LDPRACIASVRKAVCTRRPKPGVAASITQPGVGGGLGCGGVWHPRVDGGVGCCVDASVSRDACIRVGLWLAVVTRNRRRLRRLTVDGSRRRRGGCSFLA
jgi:hypothetical protein